MLKFAMITETRFALATVIGRVMMMVVVGVAVTLTASLGPAQAKAASAPVDDEEAYLCTVQVTQWADPTRQPDTYQDYLDARRRGGRSLDAPFAAKLVYRSSADVFESPDRIVVLVDGALHAAIATELTRYVRDVEVEGWGVSLWSCRDGKPAEVRAFLQARRKADGIRGCLLIGNLPVAWYEMDDDFNNRHAEFPCDLYYMDLDGTFVDVDRDGKFDGHQAAGGGDQRPDIFVGLLRASPLTPTWGTEADLVNGYLRKVHAYRIGELTAPDRALAYQDDDWYTMATYQNRAWNDVTTVSDKYATTADGYKQRLAARYASVVVCAHSSATLHSFKKPGSSGGYVRSADLWAADPPCLFYNLFACSNARYTSRSYMGGVYVFVKSTGLIAVGTTKTGSMLYFSDYYAALGRHETFGEAYRDWFARRYPYSLWDRRWFYGQTLLGDPTLRVHRAGLDASYASSGPGKGFEIAFQVDGRPDHAGDHYAIMASGTGTEPGFTFPGVRVPLTFDLFTWFFLYAANGPAFPGASGRLDVAGKAGAKFTHDGAIPPKLIGTQLHFAALVIDASTLDFRLATPPVSVTLKE